MRTVSLSLLCSFSISISSTALAAPEPPDSANVVGGTRVPAGKWRDVVLVVGRNGTLCTGTLVVPDVVLTAAHCLAADDPVEVRTDLVDYAKEHGDRIAVKWSRIYPDWSNKYDVGVIMLDHVARGRARKVAAACTTRTQLVAGAKVHLVGFGSTTPAGDDDNTVMREADLVVRDPDCMLDLACNRAIAPRGEFIAGGDGVDSCFGDSGGPVYLDTPEGPALVGIVSRGLALPGLPCGNGGIYTRVDKVVSWIQRVTGARVGRTASCDPEGPADGIEPEPVGGCSSTGGASGIVMVVLLLRCVRRRGDDVI